MSETEQLSVGDAALRALGWDPAATPVRDILPALARGHNLVVTAPPAPANAAPVLAGVLAHAASRGIVLVVAPAPSLAEWAVPAERLTAGTGVRPLLALGPGQATRRLRGGGTAGLRIAAPATHLDLQRRSLLPADEVAAVIAAWPEGWEDREALGTLLADVPKEAQRVVVTSSPAEAAPLVERHAWRAVTVGEPMTAVPVAEEVRTAAVAWSRRAAAVAEVAEVLDPASLAVWTADTSHHPELRAVLAGLGVDATVTAGETPAAAAVVAFDPPSAARLAALCATGPVTLLAPPGTEAYLARIAARRRPLVLPGALDAATGEGARRRDLVERVLRETPLEEPLVLLGPLLERHDAAAVAAALYHLWVTASRPQARPATAPAGGVTRLWIGAGKRDGIGPGDLVGLLVRELKVDRSAVGQVELRDTHALVEVPAADAARIAAALTGRTLRDRRLIARVDDRPAAPSDRRPVRRAPRPR